MSDEAEADYNYAVTNYRETTLTAFQQVEDNLAALRVLEKKQQSKPQWWKLLNDRCHSRSLDTKEASPATWR